MSTKRIKQYLLLVTAVGVVAVAASGAGTFATFNAQTTNAGNVFATGTLFLHNSVNGGTACTSESSSDNISPSNCAVLFNLTHQDASAGGAANLTLTNAGSIAASDTSFTVPSCTDSTPAIATLNGAVTQNASLSTLTVSGLNQALVAGTVLTLTDKTTPADNQNLTVDTAGAANAATSIPISGSPTATTAYGDGSPITIDTTGFSGTGLCGQLTFSIAQDTSASPSDSSGDTYQCIYPNTGSATYAGGCATGTTLGTAAGSAHSLTLPIAAGASEWLRVYVTAPDLTNADQNEQAGFDVQWKIIQ